MKMIATMSQYLVHQCHLLSLCLVPWMCKQFLNHARKLRQNPGPYHRRVLENVCTDVPKMPHWWQNIGYHWPDHKSHKIWTPQIKVKRAKIHVLWKNICTSRALLLLFLPKISIDLSREDRLSRWWKSMRWEDIRLTTAKHLSMVHGLLLRE